MAPSSVPSSSVKYSSSRAPAVEGNTAACLANSIWFSGLLTKAAKASAVDWFSDWALTVSDSMYMFGATSVMAGATATDSNMYIESLTVSAQSENQSTALAFAAITDVAPNRYIETLTVMF